MNSVGGDAGDVLLAAARVLPIRGNERGMVPVHVGWHSMPG